jgi:hypothetical protein
MRGLAPPQLASPATARHAATRLDPGACLLAPLPLGGVLVLGQQSVEYVDFSRVGTSPGQPYRVTVPLAPCVLKAWGLIDQDGSRVLISDNLVSGWM